MMLEGLRLTKATVLLLSLASFISTVSSGYNKVGYN
jgi:hypothetical protein